MARASTDPVSHDTAAFREVLQLRELSPRTRRLIALVGVLLAVAVMIPGLLAVMRGEAPSPMTFLGPLAFGGLAILYALWVVRASQETTLQDGLLQVRKRVNHKTWPTGRTIAAKKIRSLSVVPCVPVVDGPWTGSCRRAVRIVLANGDDIRLGSERPEELLAALLSAGAPAASPTTVSSEPSSPPARPA